MGSKSSVKAPPPIYIQGPTEAEIAAKKEKEAADMAKARYDVALQQRRRTNIQSQSRKTGFSGSGIFIPGGNS